MTEKTIINVYDFDDTIYDGDSTFDFYKYCLRRFPGVILRWPQLFFFAVLFIFKAVTKTKFKEVVYRFLRAVPDIDSAVADFWGSHKENIKEWYMDEKQDSDIISSASPDFLLDDICRKYLGVRLIASLVDPKTGTYTGLNNHGEEKVRRLRKKYPDVEIDKFYSDSLSDSPLAALAQSAFMVKGDKITSWPLSNGSHTK